MATAKLAIIATSTTEPGMRGVGQHSYGVLAALAPSLDVTFRCQQILGNASLLLLCRTYFAMVFGVNAGVFITLRSLLTLKNILYGIAGLCGRMGSIIWKTKSIRRLRKKIEFEFFTWILGSLGNGLFLMIFWPGWWVLGLVILTIQLVPAEGRAWLEWCIGHVVTLEAIFKRASSTL